MESSGKGEMKEDKEEEGTTATTSTAPTVTPIEEALVKLSLKSHTRTTPPPVIRILADKSWTDDDAVKQLKHVATVLDDVVLAVGLPDLHPGKGFPIGATFSTKNVVYPPLIGDDIGIKEYLIARMEICNAYLTFHFFILFCFVLIFDLFCYLLTFFFSNTNYYINTHRLWNEVLKN